jgi:hypothetical protein
LSTVNRLGVRTKNYEYTIKSIANWLKVWISFSQPQ